MDSIFNKNKIYNDLISLSTKHNDINNVINEFVNINTEDINDIVDRESIKEFILDQYYIYNSAYSPKDIKERRSIFDNMFVKEEKESFSDIYELLFELTKYDKIVIINNSRYFTKVMTMICLLYSHKEKLELLYKLEEEESHLDKGMALLKNPHRDKTVQSRINTVKDSQKICSNQSNNTLLNVMNEYKIKPQETDYMLYQLINARRHFKLDEKKLEVFFNCRNYFNAAQLIEDFHIVESARLYSFVLFRGNNLLNQMLDITKTPNNTRLADIVNSIMTLFFEDFNHKLTYKHIKKNIQSKSTFFDLELLEYRTPKTHKSHPVFND